MKAQKVSAKSTAFYIIGLLVFSAIIVIASVSLITRDALFLIDNGLLAVSMLLSVFFVLVVTYVYAVYIIRPNYKVTSQFREYIIVNSIITLVIVFSSILYSSLSPYAVPIAAVSLLVAVLLTQRLAIVCGVSSFVIMMIVCPSVAYAQNGAVSFMNLCGLIVGLISSICMTYIVHRGYTRFKITAGALAIGAGVSLISIPFAIIENDVTFIDVLKDVTFSFLGNAIAVGVSSVLLPMYEHIFRVWTDFRLAEVCSLNQPLLRQMREKAPGTLSHSLTVSILAENAAIAIGLNPFMARACAMYHDVGKVKNPQFFVENLDGGYNPHDDLIIDVSVKIITGHPEEGAEILRAKRMPDTIIKAALEHHGDSTLMFFYLKAKGITEGDLKTDEYRYSNPKPSTKYSAIIMICDMAEATIRAKKPTTKEELEDIVSNIISGRILDGQFSDCDISLQDLSKIKESICTAMPSMLHQRIDYNKAKERR